MYLSLCGPSVTSKQAEGTAFYQSLSFKVV